MKKLTKNQYIALLVLFILFILYECNRRKTVEGIENMNCCGGIKVGVHYLETDKKPPRFVKRCFKSTKGSDNRVEYDWDTFPCTQEGASKCCGGSGECIPTKKGGYCKRSDGDVVFRYKSGDSSPYIPSSRDSELDITNAFTMEDYYEDIGYSRKDLSKSQRQYETRRRSQERVIESRIIKRNIKKNLLLGGALDKKVSDIKQKQIVSTITAVHVIFILVFSLVIKDQIIDSIDEFYSLVSTKVAMFQGKTVTPPPA